jgi:hypothetical protein
MAEISRPVRGVRIPSARANRPSAQRAWTGCVFEAALHHKPRTDYASSGLFRETTLAILGYCFLIACQKVYKC